MLRGADDENENFKDLKELCEDSENCVLERAVVTELLYCWSYNCEKVLIEASLLST